MTKSALLSVSDKTGIVDAARALADLGYDLLSTGGTAKTLRDAGLPVIDVAQYTGFPEMMDGRVKTLHPLVHGGILGRRHMAEDRASMDTHGIRNVDVVICNLYPFVQTVSRPGVTLEEAIENIDIGGPSMVRSAAKNHRDVLIVVDPRDYADVLGQLRSGAVDAAVRQRLALKAFAHTAAYDAAVSQALAGMFGVDPLQLDELSFGFRRRETLRYGENPHQRAVVYADVLRGGGILAAEQLHGKELSYNNYLDADAALGLVLEFDDPAAVVIKHTNPAGVATAASLRDAYIRSRETDPVSAFGGIVAVNRTLDEATATEINTTFVEVVIAPQYDPAALELLRQKKNIRLLRLPLDVARKGRDGLDLKRISGGVLVQEPDTAVEDVAQYRVVTTRKPTDAEWRDLLFAWRVCKHVKSNAIVLARDGATVGVGAGQMSRVDSSELAARRARFPTQGCAAASDAFFPFPDGVEKLADSGATAVIQPGGSVKDDEVIAAANARGLAMVFTGFRHFRHG